MDVAVIFVLVVLAIIVINVVKSASRSARFSGMAEQTAQAKVVATRRVGGGMHVTGAGITMQHHHRSGHKEVEFELPDGRKGTYTERLFDPKLSVGDVRTIRYKGDPAVTQELYILAVT